MDTRKTAFLKQHSRAERRLTGVLRSYFQEQADRLADALLSFDDPGPGVVRLIFQAEAEHQALMRTIRRPLAVIMGTGAAELLSQAERLRSGKDFDFGFDDEPWEILMDLPADIMASIRAELSELGEQDYWQRIQAVTETRLTDLIESGIDQGANAERISRRLREELGGFEARRRARMIARTETTGALNAGHQTAGEDLQNDGFSVSKRWSATLDDDVRQEHQDMEGVAVPVDAEFILPGGIATPFPGHWGLPAHLRINCRCSTVTRVVE
jgi:hypothetical protein